jgi:hypothetical protein
LNGRVEKDVALLVFVLMFPCVFLLSHEIRLPLNLLITILLHLWADFNQELGHLYGIGLSPGGPQIAHPRVEKIRFLHPRRGQLEANQVIPTP